METASGNMCRCCASEGVFKDLATTYHWMGEEEIYGDMLRECFDIQLSSMENADGGICEVCITQLRNASNFKKQVLLTEEQFKSHLQNVFKPGIVKVEVTRDEGNSTDDNATDDGMSGPEFDDIPIKIEGTTKNEKEDLEIKPKKRSSVKPSTSTAKKSVSSDDEPLKKRGRKVKKSKAGSLKGTVQDLADVKPFAEATAVKIEIEADLKPVREVLKHIHNARVIILNSNATPVQSIGIQYECAFCFECFYVPSQLKAHILEWHELAKREYMHKHPLGSFTVKLDVTDLRCRICNESMETLELFVKHIQATHCLPYYNDIKNHIIPFKFEGNTLNCAICNTHYDNFKLLVQHMPKHFRNYECHLCNTAFITRNSCLAHVRRHEVDEVECPKCDKKFANKVKMEAHLKAVHIFKHMRYKCSECGKKFKRISLKMLHMKKKHGTEPYVVKCGACPRTFTSGLGLSHHVRRYHMLEKNVSCNVCGKKFFNRSTLKTHMAVHAQTAMYECHHCGEKYDLRQVLVRHLAIHA